MRWPWAHRQGTVSATAASSARTLAHGCRCAIKLAAVGRVACVQAARAAVRVEDCGHERLQHLPKDVQLVVGGARLNQPHDPVLSCANGSAQRTVAGKEPQTGGFRAAKHSPSVYWADDTAPAAADGPGGPASVAAIAPMGYPPPIIIIMLEAMLPRMPTPIPIIRPIIGPGIIIIPAPAIPAPGIPTPAIPAPAIPTPAIPAPAIPDGACATYMCRGDAAAACPRICECGGLVIVQCDPSGIGEEQAGVSQRHRPAESTQPIETLTR